MIVPNVLLIAAVARNGGIGLNNDLPWPRHLGDLWWFREQTMGHHVIIGARTYAGMCERLATRPRPDPVQTSWLDEEPQIMARPLLIGDDGPIPGRMVHIWNGQPAERFLQDVIEGEYGHRKIFIAGGMRCWLAFAPFVSKWLVTRIDYDGPADLFWPFPLPWTIKE